VSGPRVGSGVVGFGRRGHSGAVSPGICACVGASRVVDVGERR
jgi:hypothetical protein